MLKGINYILKYIIIENLNCNNISQYYSFFIVVYQQKKTARYDGQSK